MPGLSERTACMLLRVRRSSMRPETEKAPTYAVVDELLAERIRRLIELHPTYGYRLLWAMLRKDGVRVNRKAVYRILRLKRWLVHQRRLTPRPRVQGRRSQAEKSNTHWAMDVTHIPCGGDGWGHLAAIIDCPDRELIGFEFALRDRAKEAERALEEACIARFGTLRPDGATPVVRSDNGLIFQSRRFRAACRDYRLSQEFITPYTPQQNGMIERFFRTLKEECTWQYNFGSFLEAKATITRDGLKAAIDAAHKRGLKVTGHLCSVTYKEAAELQIDDLEHGFSKNTQFDPGKRPDLCSESQGEYTLEHMDAESAEAKELIAILVKHHVAITSTLPVLESHLEGRPPLRQQALDAMSAEAQQAFFCSGKSRCSGQRRRQTQSCCGSTS